jgi:polar amino acid transport system substrate-binding protein
MYKTTYTKRYLHEQEIRLLKIALIALALFIANPSYANQKLEVLTEAWAPFNYKKEGEITGYSSEVVKAVLNEAQIPFQIRMGVWKGVYEKALSQPNVLIYTISRTSAREDKFHWIGPIADRKQALYKLSNRADIKVSNLEDVKNYKMVVQEKDSMAEFFLSNGFSPKNPNFNLLSKQVLSLKMLFAGRVDLIPYHPLALKYKVGKDGLDERKLSKVLTLPVEGAYYMAFSKGSDATLISRAQNAFNKLRKNGDIEAIRQRYSVE